MSGPAHPAVDAEVDGAAPGTQRSNVGTEDVSSTHSTVSTVHSTVSTARAMSLQRSIGNQALARLIAQGAGVQREPDPKAPTAPQPGWENPGGDKNKGAPRKVEGTMRVAVDGLKQGNQKAFSGSHTNKDKKIEPGGANEKDKTDESGAGRAIVIVPIGFDPAKDVDVLLHLHGFTSRNVDPYAGYREDKTDHTVRDEALDRIEAQITQVGNVQVLGILAQGVGHSEFGGLQPTSYIHEVVQRLVAMSVLNTEPTTLHLILSAHSGGDATAVKALDAEVHADDPKPAKNKGKPDKEVPETTPLPPPLEIEELVLFEAINGTLDQIEGWIRFHLNRVRAAKTDDDKQKAVAACPVLRAYFTVGGNYVAAYTALDKFIKKEFDKNPAEFGPDVALLKDHFRVNPLEISATKLAEHPAYGDQVSPHEQSIRGVGDDPAQGPLADALRAHKDPNEASKLLTALPKPAAVPKDAGKPAK